MTSSPMEDYSKGLHLIIGNFTALTDVVLYSCVKEVYPIYKWENPHMK